MNAYEEMIFLVRLGFIIICTAAIAAIFWFALPSLDPTTLQAETLAGKVALGAPILIGPGIVAEERFTDQSEDFLKTTGETPLPYAVRVQALRPGDLAPLTPPVHYNRRVWALLEPQRGLRGQDNQTWTLPVTLQTRGGERQEALLRIEVLHG